MSLTESDTETEDGKTTSTFSPAHLEDEFGQTIGLPEEILLHILRFVDPKTRISCSLVAHVWRRLYVFSWTNYGTVAPSVEFHSLAAGKILRQCIPHAEWRIPDARHLPHCVDLTSPPFTQSSIEGFNLTWSSYIRVEIVLRYRRFRLTEELSESRSFAVSFELMRELENPTPVTVFCRLENPAHYAAWGRYDTKVLNLPAGTRSIPALSFDCDYRDDKEGFLYPPEFTDIEIKGFILPSVHSYVTVFTEENCFMNSSVDLFNPNGSVTNRDWTSSPTFREELIEALEKASPTKFYGDMDFWRIIMRRNHTFRPVSNVMKTYRENFYAVFAIKIPPSDQNKECIFVKFYKNNSLRYVGHLMLGQRTQVESLDSMLKELAGLDLSQEIDLFEEVHARRLDRISTVGRALADLDISSGDILVIALKDDNPTAYYETLIYTSDLIQLKPYMWHG